MSKSKFTLTSDLIKIEPEPIEILPLTSNKQEEVISNSKPTLMDNLIQPSSPEITKEVIKHENEVKIQDDKDQLSLKVERNLKRNFQIWCIQNGKTMTEALEEAMRDYLDNN